jgi:UDP-glucose 4-epimerase
MPIHVTDYYTECRYAIERLARLYHNHGVEAVGLRLFSVYGPKEEHKGRYANVVSQILWAAMRGELFVVYGDGSQTRDFIYVSDVVEAFVKAMEFDIDYGVFNVHEEGGGGPRIQGQDSPEGRGQEARQLLRAR